MLSESNQIEYRNHMHLNILTNSDSSHRDSHINIFTNSDSSHNRPSRESKGNKV